MQSSLTFFTRLTSLSPAAVGVVHLQGPQASTILDRFWKAANQDVVMKTNHIRFGVWRESSGMAGEQVVVCQIDLDAFEVHCHGGSQAIQQIVRNMTDAGAQEKSTSEWIGLRTRGAIEANALEDLMQATTLTTAMILQEQLRGALRTELSRIANGIQFGSKMLDELHRLLRCGKMGKHLLTPWRIVLTGPVNVGKSSLINCLLGYQRAIVHASAGTTRDVVQEQLTLGGWPCILQDTAGIRDTDDGIELAGIEAAMECVQQSDSVLLLVDLQVGWKGIHDRIFELAQDRCLIVGTKADLVSSDAVTCFLPHSIDVATSAVNRKGAESITQLLLRQWIPSDYRSGMGVPFRDEHLKAIHTAIHGFESNDERAHEALYSVLQ